MQHDAHSDASLPALSFPTDPSGLSEATRPALLEFADGDMSGVKG
jgi:hypothetical protein